VLETNLFLSGLGLHDQYRDLRMDIDDMSYEVLLSHSVCVYECWMDPSFCLDSRADVFCLAFVLLRNYYNWKTELVL
jgi:hypothetical protein